MMFSRYVVLGIKKILGEWIEDYKPFFISSLIQHKQSRINKMSKSYPIKFSNIEYQFPFPSLNLETKSSEHYRLLLVSPTTEHLSLSLSLSHYKLYKTHDLMRRRIKPSPSCLVTIPWVVHGVPCNHRLRLLDLYNHTVRHQECLRHWRSMLQATPHHL